MNSYSPERLTRVVAAVCPEIEVRAKSDLARNERSMWYELSCCILSSQVPFNLALAAADAIDAEGLLLKKSTTPHHLRKKLKEVLTSRLSVNGRLRSYRFPFVRAEQLAQTYCCVRKSAASLGDLVENFKDACEARNWFVLNAPGIGPKQASMFLRNIGFTYDLAILDRHVLNYMTAVGIYPERTPIVTSLAKYYLYENALRKHAHELNHPVGLLDWAIWIVMRVSNSREQVVRP
jgi:N-glycosylase/DNA lyase